jgi:hypothetical protein
MVDYGDETLCAFHVWAGVSILACRQSSSNSKCRGGNVDIWSKSEIARGPAARRSGAIEAAAALGPARRAGRLVRAVGVICWEPRQARSPHRPFSVEVHASGIEGRGPISREGFAGPRSGPRRG